jgi:hypothetical protein
MTPLDLVYDIRLRADDLGGDTGTPSTGYTYYWEENDAGCLWRNAEIIRYLNTAHREIAVRTSCYRDAGESEICQLTIRAGVATYEIDPRILTIEDALLNSTGASLVKTQLRDYRKVANTHTETGTPTQYLEENRPFRLTLSPIPIVADTLYLTVYRLPLEDMTWAGRRGDVEEPPEQLREALIQGTLSYAYQKRDADTGDAGRQQFHAQEFEKLVGPSVDYRTLENRRANANLEISIRPQGYIPRIKGTQRWYEGDD